VTQKTGPLTFDDLQIIWLGIVDPTYSTPLLEAGEGKGLEAWTQLFTILARASQAIDTTTQAMYILPSSGQTNAPAAGEAYATVDLTFTRAGNYLDRILALTPNQTYVGEQTTDWGVNGGVTVQTGRLYTPTAPLVFFPGSMGPLDVVSQAAGVGWGYNNPLPGTIQAIEQVGSGLNGVGASVTLTTLSTGAVQAALVSSQGLDQPVPDNVGQYVVFTAGANLGLVLRMTGFIPPVVNVAGSGVYLDQTAAFHGTMTGALLVGETVTFTGGCIGTVLATNPLPTGAVQLAVSVVGGPFNTIAAGAVGTGGTSGATYTVTLVDRLDLLTAETGTAAWRVLDWVADLGVAAANAQAPQGGLLGYLDDLGLERNIGRAPGESDAVYRKRVSTPADTVTPNAVRRALSKVLGPIPWCLREVGQSALPGWFFDGSNVPAGYVQSLPAPQRAAAAAQLDAYDTNAILFTGTVTSGTFGGPTYDPTNLFNSGGTFYGEPVRLLNQLGQTLFTGWFARLTSGTTFTMTSWNTNTLPASLSGCTLVGDTTGAVFTPTAATIPATVNARRFRELLSYEQMRAFFLVGVPPTGGVDYGFAYDIGASDAYDAAPYWAFFDGYSLTQVALYRNVYQSVDQVRAGGVEFELYQELIGCP
jgi:hypothetical protein